MSEYEQRHMGPIETAMKGMDYQTGPRDGIAMPPRDERPASVAEVLQKVTKSLQSSIETTNRIMCVLTGVMPETVPVVNPDSMTQHVNQIDNMSCELRRRLEDTAQAICG